MIFKSDPQNEYYTDERCHILEILNSSEKENISVARARVEPGVTTALHALEADEIYYILKGEGTAEVNGKSNSVAEGDLVFIPKGQTQRITNNTGEYLVFLCICHPRFTPERYLARE